MCNFVVLKNPLILFRPFVCLTIRKHNINLLCLKFTQNISSKPSYNLEMFSNYFKIKRYWDQQHTIGSPLSLFIKPNSISSSFGHNSNFTSKTQKTRCTLLISNLSTSSSIKKRKLYRLPNDSRCRIAHFTGCMNIINSLTPLSDNFMYSVYCKLYSKA